MIDSTHESPPASPAFAFLLNGMPKAGTHLLERVLSLFPRTRNSGVLLLPASFGIRYGDVLPAGVEIGVGRELRIAPSRLTAALDGVTAGSYAVGHVPYSCAFEAILRERGWRCVTLLRDPRDIVVSHSEYLGEQPGHHFSQLDRSARILQSILGFERRTPRAARLLDIDTRFRRILAWQSSTLNLTTRFEWLVGPAGGGSAAQQAQELHRIAQHLSLCEDADELASIASAAHGGTPTFRHGVIGRWRTAFEPAHIEAFKRIAGALLVELGYERDLDW